MIWPKYESVPESRIYFLRLISGMLSKELWKEMSVTLFYFLIYYGYIVIGTIPDTDPVLAARVVENWWLLNLIDTFFMGGALSHASILSTGLITVFVLNLKNVHQNLNEAKKIKRGEVLYMAVIALALTLWYFRNGIMEYNLSQAVITFCYLLVGAFVIRYIECQLKKMNASLSNLFVILVVIRFSHENIQSGHTENIIILVGWLMILIIPLMVLKKNKLSIPMSNVSGKSFDESVFPIPFIGDKIIFNSFFSIAFYTVIIMGLISFFGWLPIKNSMNLSLPLLLTIGFVCAVVFFLVRMPESSQTFSRFNHIAIAKGLKHEYWVFPNLRPGEQTAQFLYDHYKKLTTRSYIYVMSFMSVIIITMVTMFNKIEQFTFLQLGVIGLFFFFPTFSNMILIFYFKLLNYGKRRNSIYKWKYGMASGQSAELLNPIPDKAFVDLNSLLSSHFSKAQIEQLEKLSDGSESNINLIKEMLRIALEDRIKEKNLSLSKIIWSFAQILGICFIFTTVVFGTGVIGYQLFFPDAKLSSKDLFSILIAFFTFWLPFSISIFSLTHSSLINRFVKGVLKKD